MNDFNQECLNQLLRMNQLQAPLSMSIPCGEVTSTPHVNLATLGGSSLSSGFPAMSAQPGVHDATAAMCRGIGLPRPRAPSSVGVVGSGLHPSVRGQLGGAGMYGGIGGATAPPAGGENLLGSGAFGAPPAAPAEGAASSESMASMDMIGELFEQQARRLEAQLYQQLRDKQIMEALSARLGATSQQLQVRQLKIAEQQRAIEENEDAIRKMYDLVRTMHHESSQLLQVRETLAKDAAILRGVLLEESPERYSQHEAAAQAVLQQQTLPAYRQELPSLDELLLPANKKAGGAADSSAAALNSAQHMGTALALLSTVASRTAGADASEKDTSVGSDAGSDGARSNDTGYAGRSNGSDTGSSKNGTSNGSDTGSSKNGTADTSTLEDRAGISTGASAKESNGSDQSNGSDPGADWHSSEGESKEHEPKEQSGDRQQARKEPKAQDSESSPSLEPDPQRAAMPGAKRKR